MNRNSLLSSAALILLVLPVSSVLGDGYRTTIGQGEDKIPVVVVRGTPFEMGRVQGVLLKQSINALLPKLLATCQQAEPKRCSNENLDEAWNTVSPYTDVRFKEELRGLSEGSGIPLQLLSRVHAVPIVGDYAFSSVAAWGKATANGHLYQTRNLDWEMALEVQDHPCIVVYLPKSGIAHANITFAGFIGCNTGINAQGITLAEMGDSPGRDYPFKLDGVHFTTMFRSLLYDADSLEQAIDLMKRARRIKKYHFVVGDGQSKQGVKILAHAPDLVVWKDNDPQDELAPRVLKKIVYQDEGRGAYEPLQKSYGKIDHKSMIEMCRLLPIKGGNLLDVVYDATSLDVWVAYAEKLDEAYKRPFVHFPLKDYLDYEAGVGRAEARCAVGQ